MFLRLAVLLLGIAVLPANASTGDAVSAPADIRVEIDDGRLTLDARDAPLHRVMQAIGELAGFETVLVGSFTEPLLVNVSFADLPVREAVERLVAVENRIIVYAQSENDAEPGAISQVLLLQAGTTPTDMSFSESQSIESGSAADVRAYKLARLVAMLQPEQAEEVRLRAVRALGNFQDERAVQALAAALYDNFPSVRLEAINALGRIDIEAASRALVDFLQGDAVDAADKAVATRALSSHNTTAAQHYLGLD